MNMTKELVHDAKANKTLHSRQGSYFYRQHSTLCDFTPTVLAQVLLRPSDAVRQTVLAFENEHKLTSGYVAVHLRLPMDFVRGWCMKGGENHHVENQIIKPQDMPAGRNVTRRDICMMTDDYIDAVLKKVGGVGKPIVVAHDRDSMSSIRRAHEIKKRFGAVSYNVNNANESVIEAW